MRSVEHQNFFPFSIMEKSVTTTTTNITISLVFQFLLLLQDFIFSLQQKKNPNFFYENTLNTD